MYILLTYLLYFLWLLLFFIISIALNMERSGKNKEKTKSYLKWTVEMDRVLTSVLLDQHNLGNHPPNGWKTPAYTAAINALKEQCNITITKDNVISRLKTWDKHYSVVSAMLATSGFGWDWDHSMVQVDSEDVWRNYVMVRNINSFCIIFFCITFIFSYINVTYDLFSM